MTKSIPEMAVETRLLYQRLAKMQIGDTMSYAALNELIGRDVRQEGRGNLRTATHACLNDGIVIATVRREGVKRLADVEFVGVGEKALDSTRRKARHAIRTMMTADLNSIPSDKRTRHAAVQSALGVVSMFSKEQTVAKIESKSDGAELPLAKTLEMFK